MELLIELINKQSGMASPPPRKPNSRISFGSNSTKVFDKSRRIISPSSNDEEEPVRGQEFHYDLRYQSPPKYETFQECSEELDELSHHHKGHRQHGSDEGDDDYKEERQLPATQPAPSTRVLRPRKGRGKQKRYDVDDSSSLQEQKGQEEEKEPIEFEIKPMRVRRDPEDYESMSDIGVVTRRKKKSTLTLRDQRMQKKKKKRRNDTSLDQARLAPDEEENWGEKLKRMRRDLIDHRELSIKKRKQSEEIEEREQRYKEREEMLRKYREESEERERIERLREVEQERVNNQKLRKEEKRKKKAVRFIEGEMVKYIDRLRKSREISQRLEQEEKKKEQAKKQEQEQKEREKEQIEEHKQEQEEEKEKEEVEKQEKEEQQEGDKEQTEKQEEEEQQEMPNYEQTEGNITPPRKQSVAQIDEFKTPLNPRIPSLRTMQKHFYDYQKKEAEDRKHIQAVVEEAKQQKIYRGSKRNAGQSGDWSLGDLNARRKQLIEEMLEMNEILRVEDINKIVAETEPSQLIERIVPKRFEAIVDEEERLSFLETEQIFEKLLKSNEENEKNKKMMLEQIQRAEERKQLQERENAEMRKRLKEVFKKGKQVAEFIGFENKVNLNPLEVQNVTYKDAIKAVVRLQLKEDQELDKINKLEIAFKFSTNNGLLPFKHNPILNKAKNSLILLIQKCARNILFQEQGPSAFRMEFFLLAGQIYNILVDIAAISKMYHVRSLYVQEDQIVLNYEMWPIHLDFTIVLQVIVRINSENQVSYILDVCKIYPLFMSKFLKLEEFKQKQPDGTVLRELVMRPWRESDLNWQKHDVNKVIEDYYEIINKNWQEVLQGVQNHFLLDFSLLTEQIFYYKD